jgi:hypothetical protein
MKNIGKEEKARSLLNAVELARAGATAPNVEMITGFGSKLARALVKKYAPSHELLVRRLDAFRWFEGDSVRLLHGSCAVTSYEFQRGPLLPGEKLLQGFNTYKKMTAVPILEINSYLDIIGLYQQGSALFCSCPQCDIRHLALSGTRTECAQCNYVADLFCKGCGGEMPDRKDGERRGRPRTQCGLCHNKRKVNHKSAAWEDGSVRFLESALNSARNAVRDRNC